MSKLFACVILCGFSSSVPAQENPEIKSVLTMVAETLPEETDLSDLSSRLYYYKDHPIDLNAAKPEQLRELVFLTAIQIDNFYKHLQSAGKLHDLLELQGIDGFDTETVARLLPFVNLKITPAISSLSLHAIRFGGNNELSLRYGQVLAQQKGFQDLPGSHYLGSPVKLLLRYQYHFNDLITLSFLGEKDSGEMFLRGNNNKGFDYHSVSLAIYKSGRFEKIIIGDFSMQFGEGLTLWMGTALGRGADVAGVAKNAAGLKTSTSANESTFFRGMGVSYRLLKSLYLHPFVSLRNLDASLTRSNNGTYTLSAINSSGLHRTATEIAHKNNLRQLLFGSLINIQTSKLNLGIAVYQTHYGHEFIRSKPRYKAYAFQGKQLSNSSFHYSYTFKNSYLFGEAAYSFPGKGALLSGIMASISPCFSAVMVYRNYSREHITFYSQPLGEGSGAVNENGVYAGFHFTPSRKWSLSVYSDLARFPWLRYRVDEPSSSFQLMAQLSYTASKNLAMQMKLNIKQGEQNDTSGYPVNPVVHFKKENLRLGLQWKINPRLNFENRAEISLYQKGNRAAELGILIYQDVDFRPVSSRITAGVRLAYFSTPSYDSRIYAYEDDVLNGSGSGLYNGRGIRFYLNSNYRISRQLRIWCKYGLYNYPGSATTGSGLDEIKGSSKSEIRVQLRYQF
jgi:hypothetical protein